MRTVQMTLDPALVTAVDSAARRLKTTRSGFTRKALMDALKVLRDRDLEAKHREGYRKHPQKREEYAGWEAEQVWPD